MTEQEEPKAFAKGEIITGPSSAIPPWSECCHLRHEQYAPIKITTEISIAKEIDTEALAEAISTQLRRRNIL